MNEAHDQDPSPKNVGAVANAVSILRSLAQLSEPAGVALIARNTGVSVSTCFNILRTLSSERLVDFDPEAKTYRIGMGVLELSVPLLGANQADLIRRGMLYGV
jgi:DNA-binding IclR family transcriptional regulator